MKQSFSIPFKSVFRNFKDYIISILGMSMAFIVAIFILIYVNDQLSMDKSQGNYDNIYRLERDGWALMAGGVIPWVPEQFPEVISYTRIGGTYWESMVDYQNKFHKVDKVLFIDGKPFDVFDFEFEYGNPETALDAPNAAILTNKLAARIFADENPLGKLLNYNGEFPLVVTAVIKEENDLHLEFDMLVKFSMLTDVWYNGNNSFMSALNGGQNFMAYMVLNSDKPDALVEKINTKLIDIGAYDAENDPPNYLMRPFKNIYFFNDAVTEHGVKHGNFQTIIALIFVALFVLVIATINYINVTTAKGITRAKEVGLRKLVGSGRKNIILQFIYESVLISIIAMLLSILILLILYNPFQTSIDISLPALTNLSPQIYFLCIGILLLTSLTGGLYPALYMSSLKPGILFSTDLKSGGKGMFVRRALIFIQFVIAIFLTIQSIAIFKQYLFMKNKDLGMNIDQIIHFEIPDYLSDRSDAIRDALKENPGINEVSFALQPLGNIRNTNTLASPLTEVQVPFKMQLTDPEYFTVLGLEMLSGRPFSREREGDRNVAWIINETGARALGFDPPESITNLKWAAYGRDREFDIIGVVKDYHFNSVNRPIEPTILRWADGFNMAQLSFSSDDIKGILTHIEDVWSRFEQKRPLNYNFLDETFDKNYVSEQRLGSLIGVFTFIAVLIGCFGVYGISAIMARQMSKNISLRRVMGADTKSLVVMFTSEYLWIIGIAGLVAVPLAYLYINSWLSRFPYKTDVGAWIFVVAFLLNLLITIATVAYHAFRTARLNPAEVLRYE